MPRIHGTRAAIDARKVNAFFAGRCREDGSMASMMLRRDPGDGVAEKRNAKEVELLFDLVRPDTGFSVLDLGCGPGRWAQNLADRVGCYVGVDFVARHVEVAQRAHASRDNVVFLQMDAADLDVGALPCSSYDLVLITGLQVYLNDPDVETLLEKLPGLAARHLYIRESVSVTGTRLTLKDYPSEELGEPYHAIYRTPEEYAELFASHLEGFALQATDRFLTRELGARDETNQHYWLFDRRG
jgi:SAM-dependent methyltransferase